MTTRKFVRRMLQKKRKLQHRPSLTRGDMDDRYSLFRPYNTPRGRTAEPNDVCFRCGSKSHFRRDCRVRIPIGIQPGGTRIQAVQQPVQWGRFLSHRPGLYLSHRQEEQETQQPEVKYNFSSHDPNDVCTIPEFEYQEQ